MGCICALHGVCAMTTYRCPAGTFADGLLAMTDAEYSETVDNSPPIGDAYIVLGRIGRPMATACAYAATFGINSRISGPVRGDAPADGRARRRG